MFVLRGNFKKTTWKLFKYFYSASIREDQLNLVQVYFRLIPLDEGGRKW
jgi:hypothetical protein